MKNQAIPWKILAERDFGLFWSSLLVSSVGTQISTVTIAWQVYEITNSPFQLGLTGLFRALPVIIFSLTGGLLADRMDRRRLLMVTQGLAMILAFILGLLTSTGHVRVWHIYAITFLSGAVSTFDQPARYAMIPNLVAREHLTTAFALNVTLRQTASLAGPFVAGLVIAGVGISWSYYINALSFLGLIVCLLFIRVRASASPARVEPALQGMREGLSFVLENSVILGLLVMDACVVFFGAYRAMMPVFARDLLSVGPKGLGALLGAPAAGALLGSAIVIGLGNPRGKGRLIILVTLIYTMGLVLFALSHSFLLSLAIAFSLGALDAVGETLRVTVIQLMTPDHLRGRVQALVHVFVFAGPHMGHAMIGATAAILGAPGAIIMGGLISAAVVAWMARKVSPLTRFEI